MNDKKFNYKPLKIVQSRGSRVGGHHRDKKQRITEALNDLSLVIAGIASGGEGLQNYDLLVQDTASWARACALFLRKVVLGEGRNPGARLLDDDVLESLEIHLQPLRKIPQKRRRTIETGINFNRVQVEFIRRDNADHEPQERLFAVGGPQGLSITVEWPLVGMADWTDPPTEANPWRVSPDQLFDTHSKNDMNCSNWLGQQVVLFNKQGITLEKLIRTIANYEAAHAVNVGRLMSFEGKNPSKIQKDHNIHILRNITFFGLGYAELVIIEAGMYLYERLMKEASIKRPIDSYILGTPAFECCPEDTTSRQPKWLSYRGMIMFDFSPQPGVVSYSVQVPS